MNEENDEYRRKQFAVEASESAEEIQKNKNIEFDAWKLVQIGNTWGLPVN